MRIRAESEPDDFYDLTGSHRIALDNVMSMVLAIRRRDGQDQNIEIIGGFYPVAVIGEKAPGLPTSVLGE